MDRTNPQTPSSQDRRPCRTQGNDPRTTPILPRQTLNVPALCSNRPLRTRVRSHYPSGSNASERKNLAPPRIQCPLRYTTRTPHIPRTTTTLPTTTPRRVPQMQVEIQRPVPATNLHLPSRMTRTHRARHKPTLPRVLTSTALLNLPNLRPIQNALNYFPGLRVTRVNLRQLPQNSRGTLKPICPNQTSPPWKLLPLHANHHQNRRPTVNEWE